METPVKDVKPVSMPATPDALPQQRMVVPAERELPGESEHDGKSGGRIYTAEFDEKEIRPQQMKSATEYQRETADPGKLPPFHKYTELTYPETKIRG